MLSRKFTLRNFQTYVFQQNFAGSIDILGFLGVEDIGVLDGDIVYHTFCTMCFNTCFATSYVDVAHVDILKVWQEFLLYGSCLLLGTYMVVKISGLKGDGCILDIGHVDMVDIDVL